MTGLNKAIAYSRRQLGLLRKYGQADEIEGAEQLDAWLGQLAAQQAPEEIKQAAGFARRDPAATSSGEEGRR